MRAFAIFCALALASAALAAPVAVELRAHSEVAGEFFTLGDIAEVRGDDATAQTLRARRIGRSPRAGATLAISRADLERRLAGAVVTGSDTAVVQRGPLQNLGARDVRDAAERALRAALDMRYEDFALAPLRGGGGDRLIPAGTLELRARVPASPARAGRGTVWVDVLVDGRTYQSLPVAFDVRGLRDVLVARRDLAPGARLQPGDFTVLRADAAALAHAPLTAAAAHDDLRVVRPVRAGSALTTANVAPRRAVRRDEELRVRASIGAIVVETTAVATRDAAAGEVVRVRNAGSGESFYVRVTAPGLALAGGGMR